jgi:hypothetical protein
MRYCPRCNAQFPDEHRKCIHCGGRLRDAPPADSPEQTDAAAPEGFHFLDRRQPSKAVPLLEALSAAGIGCTVVTEDGVEYADMRWGSFGRHAAIEIYVDAEQLAEAEAIIRDELAPLMEELPDSVEYEPGHCPACGYPVSEQATECPDCGLGF